VHLLSNYCTHDTKPGIEGSRIGSSLQVREKIPSPYYVIAMICGTRHPERMVAQCRKVVAQGRKTSERILIGRELRREGPTFPMHALVQMCARVAMCPYVHVCAQVCAHGCVLTYTLGANV
jgi:hypothetical protein